jgi:hypothetical protein
MPVQGEIMSETLAEQEPSLICRHTTAANCLSVGRISLRQPAAEAETDKGPHRALAAWTWGHYALPELYLRLLERATKGFIGHVVKKMVDVVCVHPAFATATDNVICGAMGGSTWEQPERRSTWA